MPDYRGAIFVPALFTKDIARLRFADGWQLRQNLG